MTPQSYREEEDGFLFNVGLVAFLLCAALAAGLVWLISALL